MEPISLEELLQKFDELSGDFDRLLKLLNTYGLTGPLLREVKALMVERKERGGATEQVQEPPVAPSDAAATVEEASAGSGVPAEQEV